ncbi:MAG: tRNA (uridine(34)/cytosine(34)/5-carboxymethylaminomethyluridine(34)-2'-O)-methyltransferase TrmL [Proteobacteria bacterium]|nr:tRNA (uridine(34)/cytosine(34)/5-carboxymethylaminomethyluridine(34)-2'-O)-methyltransferase TrmL [Pseudomonadota bacterium]
MIDVVLFEPEIPPNTGNVIRLCANTGARLHLVEPLGFRIDDKELKRAGLDYHEYADMRVHKDWAACLALLAGRRLFALTTRGTRRPSEVHWRENDVMVFGAETRGLPQAVLDTFATDHRLRLPLRPGNRSLNLSNAVAVTVFEAWRQLGFEGGT